MFVIKFRRNVCKMTFTFRNPSFPFPPLISLAVPVQFRECVCVCAHVGSRERVHWKGAGHPVAYLKFGLGGGFNRVAFRKKKKQVNNNQH